MKKLSTRIALVLVLFNTSVFATTPTEEPLSSGIELKNIDNSVRPQDDFYGYVNGTWLENTVIPEDKSGWGAFYILSDKVRSQLHGIITGLDNNPNLKTGSNAQKIRDLYDSYMDTQVIDKLGLKPLDPIFAKIDAISNKDQLPALMAYFSLVGIKAPLDMSVHQDNKDSTKYIADLSQSGLGLPDRDYYLKDEDAKLREMRDGYQKHIETMLTMMGEEQAAKKAASIIQLETTIAKVQWTKVEQRDAVKSYNRFELSKLDKLMPNYSLTAFLKEVGVADKVSYVIVSQPSYFEGLSKVIQETPIATWKTYFKWHTLSANASLLPANYSDEHFAFFGKKLNGIPVQEVRWKRAVRFVSGDLGEALGELYVARYFPPEYKAKMEKLVSNLMIAYEQSINQLDWMSPATKKAAQKKLAAMGLKIGYPVKWRNYGALTIKKDDLIGNSLRANQFQAQYEINKLGKPIDRTEWGMTPQTINAYNNFEMNEIVFPAAILQPPFFNANADDAVNYGAIGAVIGHEISHAFDDQGSQYDEKGNLRNWWTKQDHQKFTKKTAALIKQYNAFSPIPNYPINGELTLGENIADNSGLAIAFKAYKISLDGKPAPVIDGLTGEQRFYMGFAQAWQDKTRDEATLVQIKSDPHSPAKFRAQGSVQNQPDFYKAFNVRKDDKMYVAPKDRVTIW